MTERKRVAVLVSGAGTNLQALLDASSAPDYPAQVVLVVTNVPGVAAIERAKEAGVPSMTLPHQNYGTRTDFDRALAELLTSHGIELVCLAGFMRLLGPEFLRPFAGRVLNIHPALLPAFPGINAVRQALLYGTKVAGCTVHLVDEGTDTGPILAQAAVPVLADDNEGTLTARIRREELRIYPIALRWMAEGKVRLEERRAVVPSN